MGFRTLVCISRVVVEQSSISAGVLLCLIAFTRGPWL